MLSAATVSRGRFDGFPIVSERPLFARRRRPESTNIVEKLVNRGAKEILHLRE
jgi:hypothetical protein